MYTLKELEKYTKGKILSGNEKKIITHYSLNYEFNMKDGFFVPVDFHGEDREKHIIEAVKCGSMGFMINRNSIKKEYIINEALKINTNLCILEVDNVNTAIFTLAKIIREKYKNTPIIGITGSVGKTTMSRILSNILKKEKKLFHDFDDRNLNSKVLISTDLMHIENYEMAVIEMGTSSPGAMHILSELVRPSIGVITTIGTAHLNKFRTKEKILEDKLHITDFFQDEKILFINSDDELLNNIEETDSYKLVKCSKNEASNIIETETGLSFEINIYNQKTKFNLNLYGLHYLTSIIIAIRIAEHYKIKYENIIEGINEFKPIDGRCKILKDKKNNLTLIDDAYSSSIESAKCGLDIANKLTSKRKIAVLGKMAAYGEEADKMHEDLGKYFNNLDFDYLYLTGEYSKHIFKGALSCLEEKRIKKFKTKEQLIVELKNNIEEGDLIYIKAARTQKFDEIVDALKDKYFFI